MAHTAASTASTALPPSPQPRPAGGDGIADALTQLLAADGGIGAGAAVDEERGHAACHDGVRTASIMA